MMAGGFASITAALKVAYPSTAIAKMANEQGIWTSMYGGGSSFTLQMACLLGGAEDPEMWESLDDMFDSVKHRKLIEKWRDGTLKPHEARWPVRRGIDQRPERTFETDHSAAKRAAPKAQQPRRRPRGRARSSPNTR